MNQPQPKMDVHVRFRVEAVRDSLIRRRRWRCLRRFALGLLVLLSGFLIFWLIFKPYGSVATLAQLLFWPAVAGLVWHFLWEPLRKPVTNADAALLIDRLHPELQDRTTVLVALDENGQKPGWMEGEFVDEARSTIVRSRFGQNWDLVPFGQSPGRILALLFISLLILAWFPFVWQPFYGESWGLGHRFKVEPGNVKVQVGSDQIILLKGGDVGDAAQILWRGSGQEWQEAGMAIGDSHDIRFYRLANIRQDLQYKIHVGSWESPRFELTTWLPAEVTGIDLTYHYPEYLALPPREVSEAGQITALEGSNIQLRIQVNKTLKQAEMVFDSGRRIRFSQSEPLVWTGNFIADRDDVYHFELLDRDGQAGLFQPGYEIAVSRDREPVIQMAFPYNDLQVSPIDEVPFTFSLTDDFGLTAFGLRYQVEGRDPVWLDLEKNLENNLSVQVEHMLFLENVDLEPGDLINWTIWAKDQKPDRPEYEIHGPPYFLEIRPFRRLFRESISDQGAAMQQPGQDDLVTQQKEVVIAIWNLRRVSGQLEAGPLEEKNGSILARESAIVQQVGQTMDQSQEEVVELLNALNETVGQLQKTSLPQPQGTLSSAAVSAQTAYRLLLKLEPEESRVQRSSGQSGGQSASMREAGGTQDLEMDRNRNYYENENLTQNRQEAVKEALNKLDELTRRQQLINEEIAGLISELQKKDDPEMRRRLERLQDEIRKNIEKLDQMQRDVNQMEPGDGGLTQNQMDQARQQMQQSLEELSQDRLQEARAAGNRAMDDLQKLEQDLKHQASGSASERMESLRDSLSQMEKSQQEIREKVRQLQGQKGRPSLQADAGADRARAQLLEQKQQLQQQFRQMIEEASQLEEFSRSSQELLARELGDWLRKTSREGLDEEIEETKELAGYGLWQELEERERLIQEKLAEASRNFSKVEGRLVENETDAQAMALAEITDLLKSLPQQSLSASDLKQWTERGYKEWLDGVENASSLLGGETPLSRDLNRIRREIESIRHEYRQKGSYPDKELIINAVLNPLESMAHQLEQELSDRRRQKEFILRDDGSVPDQYRKTVSEYFRLLSESEGKR